jgi:hypothetical protein
MNALSRGLRTRAGACIRFDQPADALPITLKISGPEAGTVRVVDRDEPDFRYGGTAALAPAAVGNTAAVQAVPVEHAGSRLGRFLIVVTDTLTHAVSSVRDMPISGEVVIIRVANSASVR